MKKIFSVILALVLVLAIAAPAMAITGYVSPIVQATASAPLAVDMTLVSDDAAGLGLLGLTAGAVDKAYVMNEVIYGRIDVAANPKTTWAMYDWAATDLIISSNAVDFQRGYAYQIKGGTSDVLLSGDNGSVTKIGDIKPDSNNKMTWTIPALENYSVLFSGVVQGQGSIVAELRGGNKEYFEGIDGKLSTEAYYICDDLGATQYSMKLDGTNVVVEVFEKGAKIGDVIFGRDAKNICNTIVVNGGVVAYTAPISSGGAIIESIGGYTAEDTTGTYKTLKAIYDEVMAFFGFDYNVKGELLDAHFTSKLHSFYDVDTVAVNFYSNAITIPGADVDIPQTGDAATTIGFVMVAMAIVVAAAVAYKKVRN